MNEQHPEQVQRIGEAELRMALRGLRQDLAPCHELWPGIAARIQSLPQQSSSPLAARNSSWWPVATAASMLLAVGVAWQLKPSAAPTPAPATQASAAATLVQREADSMTVQYRAALQEFDPRTAPASWQPGLEALDRSAAEIRGALRDDPNSRLLLERLRDTYTRRLALARRALYA